MAFIDDIPNWESLSSDEFEMRKISTSLQSNIEGLVMYCIAQDPQESFNLFQGILYRFSGALKASPPFGCSIPDLRYEMDSMVRKIDTMPKLMDCLDILFEWGISQGDVNQFLKDNDIGYEYVDDSERGTGWSVRDSTAATVERLAEAQSSIQTISSQAYEHINRALAGLKGIEDERTRKDVVWALICGLESVVKNIAKTDKKLPRAIEKIINEGEQWGNKTIILEGKDLFDILQREYRDLRHGTDEANKSSMSAEEACYWVERIACYIRYMSKMAKKLGRD